MRLQDLFRDNDMILSDKGRLCLRKAVKDAFPILHHLDDAMTGRFMWLYDLNDEDCLRILNLTVKYASLWAFS